MAHEFAVRLALIAFATAAMRGLFSGADFQPAIQTALLALGAFYVVGLVCGEVARRLVEEYAPQQYAREKQAAEGN